MTFFALTGKSRHDIAQQACLLPAIAGRKMKRLDAAYYGFARDSSGGYRRQMCTSAASAVSAFARNPEPEMAM
jgi:hypothetical protein